MTALTEGRLGRRLDGSAGPMPARFCDPVKGSTRIFLGALVALSTAGFAQPGASTAGLVCRGRALAEVDNRDGSDGDLTVETEAGAFRFENSSSTDAITKADIGKLAFLVDDQTVARTSNGGARSVAGLIVQVDDAGVFVLVGVLPTGSLQELMVRQVTFNKAAADALAADTFAEHAFFRAETAVRVLGVYYVPDATLTGHASNNATLAVATRDGAGGGSSAVASKTTTAVNGNWAAFTPVSLGAVSNGALAAGAVLTFAISKGSSGVIVPAGHLVVLYEPA